MTSFRYHVKPPANCMVIIQLQISSTRPDGRDSKAIEMCLPVSSGMEAWSE